MRPTTVVAQYRRELQKRVFDFWFGGASLPSDAPLDAKCLRLWFGADPQVDRSLKELFMNDLSKVCQNEDGLYDSLTEEPHVRAVSPALGSIIVWLTAQTPSCTECLGRSYPPRPIQSQYFPRHS